MTSRIERERGFYDRLYAPSRSVRREHVWRLGGIGQLAARTFLEVATKLCPDQDVLEFGCGTGQLSLVLLENNAKHVTGIDISEVAIEQAVDGAKVRGMTNVEFHVMDAMQLDFPESSFDLIVGKAILHHLDLEKSLAELARVTRRDGAVFFIEPLGHNPFINIYRFLTPSLRTADESPLTYRDLGRIGHHFEFVERKYLNLTTLLLFVLPRRLPGYYRLLKMLARLDQLLFKWVPFSRRFAWNVLILAENPLAHRKVMA